MRLRLAIFFLLVFGFVSGGLAQTGDGSLRGYVRDESGAVLPGVTVTATSEVLMSPRTTVTDAAGYYRVVNLPPGEYALMAELPGFAVFRQEGILLRAGANFGVDILMTIGSVEETITVTAETPMLEISSPTNVLNVDGEFHEAVPVESRRNWTDFLELTPGVNARANDDGSGRRIYWAHGAEQFHHVVQVEGMIASAYNDAQVGFVSTSKRTIEDIEVKAGGADAASPLGVGLVINVVSKSGGNEFHGGAGYVLQPLSWNGDNTESGPAGAGTPTVQEVNQLDFSLGGPIAQDKAWFFFAGRWARLKNGISRTAEEIQNLQDFSPGWEPFDNSADSFQPYAKVTAAINPSQQFSGYYQYDRVVNTGAREYMAEVLRTRVSGGKLFGAKLSSIWNTNVTSQITFNWNDKSSVNNDIKDYDSLASEWGLGGPQIVYHEDAFPSAGRFVGTGRLVECCNLQSSQDRPASLLAMRGDLTIFKEQWAGSHEFKTGIFLAPRYRSRTNDVYLNDGFILEEHRLVDPNDRNSGTIPFHRRYRSPTEVTSIFAQDSDIGVYFQDSWKPHPRLTLSLGLRVDFTKRYDGVFDITRQDSVEIGPRFGVSWLVTPDGRTVARGSIVRVHYAVMGRDGPSTFAGGGRTATLDTYDFDGDGIFETEVETPLVPASLGGYEFDPDLHQPFIDEYQVGLRRQFPGQISVDGAYILRYFVDTFALTDVNGIYPDGPYQPFIGFGKVDPSRGILNQQTNNTWSQQVYSAIQLTLTKNMADNWQFMAGFNRAWQHFDGTWNPTDPARFIQPDAFPSNKLIYVSRGNNEHNSLDGGNSYGPAWAKYSLRLGASWLAPADIVVAASWTQQAGPYSGWIVDRLPAGDPQFGPPRVPVEGGTQPNPLATRIRFAYPTRGEGQYTAPTIKTLNLKVGRQFTLSGNHRFEISANIFNVLNGGDHTQFSYSGSNQLYNPNYGLMRNRQAARGFQLSFDYNF